MSKAVETLYTSEIINRKYYLIKVDITSNKRFLVNYRKISNIDADLFYFTISQSIGGNIRDLIILRRLRKQKKKCLIHLHGGYYRQLLENDMGSIQKKWNIKAMKEVSGAIVLGKSLRYIYEGLVKNIYIVPNCVDDEFLLDDIDNKPSTEVYHILYLSNFIRTKGYDIVLNMAKIYKNTAIEKKLHFDFAGRFYGDEEEQYFNDFIKDNNLDDIVTYHGVVTGNEKRKLLKYSTFFILPTNYPKEGQPISILEAMGNGMIILTTNHAGIPDIVEDKKNGCVLPWSTNLDLMYMDYINSITDEEIQAIEENNYNIVKDNYLEADYINNLNNLFDKVTV